MASLNLAGAISTANGITIKPRANRNEAVVS
jgi:hypothetical protein